ncbi:zinc ribbon domain-containing protein [Lutibacter sp. B2]|nr:zinc ribbon domain-containing protein [Lutibacter sp. B2]
MDNEKIRKQFKRGKKCNEIGFLIILLATIPGVLLEGLMKYILVIIIFGIGVYFERQYKCPSCGYVFDPRAKSNELIYCPKCSIKLQ